MSFSKFWNDLQANLGVGTNIKNWTAIKGFMVDEFKIANISPKGIKIESPNQYVTKSDFEVTYNNWEKYCLRKFTRRELSDLTRCSKYTISIIKHLKN